MGSALRVQQVPATGNAPVQNKSDPFLANAPILLRMPPAGGTFHGVNESKLATILAEIRGDGVLQLWDETSFPIFAGADDDGAAAIAAADYLRIIATVNGQPIKRAVSAAGNPPAGEFSMYNSGVMEFKTGTVYGAGTVIKVYVQAAGDIVNQVVAADALAD